MGRYDPGRWEPPPRRGNGVPQRTPTPTTRWSSTRTSVRVLDRSSVNPGLGPRGFGHDPTTWWVPFWDPEVERVDPWLNRVDFSGVYGGRAA